MKFIHRKSLFFIFTLLIIAVCTIFVSLISGYGHGAKKMLSIFYNVFVVLIFLFLVSDGIKFAVMAVHRAWWPRQQGKVFTHPDVTVHSREDFLKLRLNGLRSQLLVTEEHRNESLNLMYQTIARDLFLYGAYFFFLMCLVLATRQELVFYDYSTKERLFLKNQSLTYGLEHIRKIDDVYGFINSTLIMAFNPNKSESGKSDWAYGDHTTKVGVVQLRQLRRRDDWHFGWNDQMFASRDYMPNWELPYTRTSYTDKYWRIYEPWLPHTEVINKFVSFFLDTDHRGYFQNYPDQVGYITLLARSTNNSQIVLNYLQKHNWLNMNTSAIFMDFTLYNADAHIYTITTLLLEQTPFGTVVPRVELSSLRLQKFDQLGTFGIFIVIAYILVLIQFGKTFVITLWYEPSKLRSMWYKIDLIILILNIVAMVILIVLEVYVAQLLTKVEGASKLEFMNFRHPERLNLVFIVTLGFLVCITTLRLWRVLQFANVFQLFSSTLYSAWKALAATAVIIVIFLMAFGMAVVIINGNNSDNFNQVTRSFVSAMCFSFGFSSQITPDDLFHGGKFLGLVFYLILVFVLAQLLINIFISTINDYFEKARALRNARVVRRINFLQFLRVEYVGFFKIFQKLPCFNRAYKRRNRTVAENIKLRLDQQERWSSKRRYKALIEQDQNNPETPFKISDEDNKHAKYKRRIERMLTVAAILQAQMELLEHFIFPDEENNSVEESDEEDDNISLDNEEESEENDLKK